MKAEDIEFIRKTLPPPFNTVEHYEEFFRPKLQKHGVLCSTTIKTVREIVLDPLIDRHSNRFFCRIDDSHTLKSPASIVEKIRKSQKPTSKVKTGESPEPYDLDNFTEKMTDIARFRIVCNFLNDVEGVAEQIKYSEKIRSFFNVQETSTINLHKRASGERSIKFVLEFRSRPGLFLEIQVMTQLQEAWDKKDHYLVYEKRRSSSKDDDENFPTYLDSKMFAMAELLYVADNYFDQLRLEEDES
jgi:ppGpp synthetase/RelA/SpoT-type nucleotidyltranferase